MNEADPKVRRTKEESKAHRREYQRQFAARYRVANAKVDRRDYFREYDKKKLPIYRARKKEVDAIRYAKNREENLARNAKFHRENKEEIAVRKRAWREENIEVVKPREEAYRKSERGKIANNACKRKRHAQKFGCELRATPLEILALKERSTHCHYCRKPRELVKLTVDHYIPLALGGAHAIGNLVMACKSCNSRKSKLTPEQWAMRSGFTFSPPSAQMVLD